MPFERESVRGLRRTIDLAPVGIAHVAGDGRFLLVNDALCRLTGFTRQELLERTFQEVSYPDDVAGCVSLLTQVATGELPSFKHEKRFVRSDGSVVWSCVTVSAVRGKGGAFAFFVGIAEDITERRAIDERTRGVLGRIATLALRPATDGRALDEIRRVALEYERTIPDRPQDEHRDEARSA